MPKRLVSGTDAGPESLETRIFYDAPDQIREIDSRGVETTTEFDAWLRPVHVVTKGSDPLVLEEWLRYNATGRVEAHSVRQGTSLVIISYKYDPISRVLTAKRDGVAVPGGSTSVQFTYNLPSREVTATRSGGAQTTMTLDRLGRVVRERTLTGTTAASPPLEKHHAYDLAGNRVFETDLFTAGATVRRP